MSWLYMCVSISEYVREGLTERRRGRRKGRERDTEKRTPWPTRTHVPAYLDAQDSRLSLSRGSWSSQCSHRVGGGGGGEREGRAARRGRPGKQVRPRLIDISIINRFSIL